MSIGASGSNVEQAELAASYSGNPEDPSVVLLESGGRLDPFWTEVAAALAKAGRHVIRIRILQDASDEAVFRALRAVLSELQARPVIVTEGDDANVIANIFGGGAQLVSGIVLVDPDLSTGATLDAGDQAGLPILVATGVQLGKASSSRAPDIRHVSSSEAVEIGAEQALTQSDRTDTFSAVLVDFLERRLPRAAPEYRLGSDARTLRDALGCFATGVTVLTTLDADGTPVGLTANSFTSVSLEPPLLLACISGTASSAAAFQTASHFAVNVLHMGQQQTSQRFSKRGEDRFGETDWEAGLHGTPVIVGSLATFECSRHALHEGGDHLIIVGQVERARFEPSRDPLLYFRGKYRRLHFS